MPPRVDAVFQALADPTRRHLIESLAREPATATRLAAGLPISRQAVAKHLVLLNAAHLVNAQRVGRETRYSLDAAPLSEAAGWLAHVGAEWDERLAALRSVLGD